MKILQYKIGSSAGINMHEQSGFENENVWLFQNLTKTQRSLLVTLTPWLFADLPYIRT